jgi:hypothetical protein
MSVIRFTEPFEYIETPTNGSPVYVYLTGPGCQYRIATWDQTKDRPGCPAEWDGDATVPARTMTECICRLLHRADYYDVEGVQEALETYHRDWMDGC